jgi:hypothetical protein
MSRRRLARRESLGCRLCIRGKIPVGIVLETQGVIYLHLIGNFMVASKSAVGRASIPTAAEMSMPPLRMELSRRGDGGGAFKETLKHMVQPKNTRIHAEFF